MHIEEFRAYCLAKDHVTEEFPFGPDTLVFKAMGKMFALTGLDNPTFLVNLKADPEKSILLRDEYPEIAPGYHMNKKHWNTIQLNEDADLKIVKKLIEDSYQIVKNSLPKSIKDTLL